MPLQMFRDASLGICRNVRDGFRQHLREGRGKTRHGRRRQRRALLELSGSLRCLQLLLFRRDLRIDLLIFRQGDERVDTHSGEMPRRHPAVIAYLGIFPPYLFFQRVHARRERHALRSDNHPVKIATMLGADRIAREDVFADIRAIEHRYIREYSGPCAITKRDRSRRCQKVDFRIAGHTERPAADHNCGRIRE